MPDGLGAVWLGNDRWRFRVWAPSADQVHTHLVAPEERMVCMERQKSGYHEAVITGIAAGTRYVYRLPGGGEFPDPASRYQPEGVHGPSEVVDPRFDWHDENWSGIPLEDYIIYEIHTGTFTPGGTFEDIIPYLSDLTDLGITAIELMPVAQFPGTRNWGYDGVYPYAVQNSYGGPLGLKRLVDACHQDGLAVILDVVYNHIGPEGNYLRQFAPYFTQRYRTPWGPALNFDDAHSDEVRHFFIANAIEWITEYHIDALRLDAIHAILDQSALNILEELGEAVRARAKELNRRVHIIAESALNDTRIIRSQDTGGYGLDAQWNDDFHHSLHTLLTRESEGYYADFGDLQHMACAFSEGFVYSGHYSVARGRRHGNSSKALPPMQFVVFAQNHDQIGNRMMGERMGHLVSPEATKLASGTVLLSPFLPLLFMGEEYGESAPFLYFIHHSDPALIRAVRQGRKQEFVRFKWRGKPGDPQAESTFERSKLNHSLKTKQPHRALLAWYKELIRLRKALPALRSLSKDQMDIACFEKERVLAVRRWSGPNEVIAIFNFNDSPRHFQKSLPGIWRKQLDSSDPRFSGGGTTAPDLIDTVAVDDGMMLQPYGVLLYEKEAGE